MKMMIRHSRGGHVAQHFPSVWLAGIGIRQGVGGHCTTLQFLWFPAPIRLSPNASSIDTCLIVLQTYTLAYESTSAKMLYVTIMACEDDG